MTDSAPQTLDLRGYLRPLRSRWWIVVLIAVAAAGFTHEYFANKPKSYSASTSLLLAPAGESAAGADRDRSIREQAVIIGTRTIAAMVAEELALTGSPKVLPGVVIAAPAEGTSFLRLTSTSSNPRSAIDLVNAYARVYIRYSGEAGRAQAKTARIAAERRLRQIADTPQNRLTRLQLDATIQSLGVQENSSQSNAQQVEPALAAAQVGASPLRNAMFALVLGALLGLALAYALEHLDRRLQRVDEIGELYDSVVLVAVPGAPVAAEASRLGLKLEPPLTEAFRTLRTTLQFQATDSAGGNGAPLRTMLVTSAISGEGKSMVARSLALAYYEAGVRVALVDADLRRPTVAESFNLDAEPGLTDVLRGRDVSDVLRFVWRRPEEGAGRQVAMAGMTAALQREAVGAGAERMVRAGRSVLSRRRRPAEGARAVAATGSESHDNDVANDPGLTVLTSGRAPRDPAALLAGGHVGRVLSDLKASHDIVIVDASPLLPVSDAVPLLGAVDGVLVVSRIGVTTRHAAAQLTDLLARVPNVNVVGVVVNDVREEAGYGYGGYGYGPA